MVTSKFYISNDFRMTDMTWCDPSAWNDEHWRGIIPWLPNGGLNRPFSEVMVIYVYIYSILYIHTKWLITRSKVDMGWVHTNGTIELGFNGFNAPSFTGQDFEFSPDLG